MKKELSSVELKRRKRKRKIRTRRFIILLLVLTVIFSAAYIVFFKTSAFPVKKLAITGSRIYTRNQIKEASGINSETPIMSVNKRELAKKLQKKLPFIETVNVKLKLPDEIIIAVSDAVEVFAFKTAKGYVTSNGDFRTLKEYTELPEGTVEVLVKGQRFKIGGEMEFSSADEKELVKYLYSYLESSGIKVNKIDTTSTVHITVRVEDRFEVNFGSNDNIKEKIDQLAAMIPEIGDRKGRINLEMWSQSDSKGTFIEEN